MQQTENLAPHVQEIARALSNKIEPEAIEDELRRYIEYGVPLAKAKQDIVRMHGGNLAAGERKIATILPEEKGIEIVAKILTVNPKEVTVKGQPRTLWYGFIADETGKTSYTAWKDFKLQRGTVVRIRNAYAKKGFREGVEVSLGDYTLVDVLPNVTLDVKDTYADAPAGDASSRVVTERTIRELRDGMGGVAVTGRILDVRERTVSTANGQKRLVEGELADATGRVSFSAWEPQNLSPGFAPNAVVRVRSAYVRAYRGVPNLNINQYTTIEILADDTLPDAASLSEERAYHLAEIASMGGGEGLLVEGVLLEVKKGSGIIFRCPHVEEGRTCNRVLQKSECRIHGKQKGAPDLRIKAVLDDGYGAATVFVGREPTERVLGRSLDEAQAMARDAMTVDVVQDALMEKLTARRVVVRGRALSDEFGLQILASDLTFAPERDAQAEAEKLLGAVAEVLQEVAQ